MGGLNLATITAQNILDENNWDSTDDISLANCERLIDDSIDYINLMAGLSISNMSGAAGSKTVTVTSGQSAVIKPLASLMVRAYLDKGPNMAVSPISINTLISDPHYNLFMKLLNKGINRLRGRSFERT